MIAPNGDHPGSHRTAHPHAISIAAPLHQKNRTTPNDLFPAVAGDPDLTLIYALLGGTVMLLLFALAWSLVN
jgi:hypothetical protein